MTGETLMHYGAGRAVRELADRCIKHPELGKDPECVIATERDKMLRELAEPEPAVKVQHLNGHGKALVRRKA